MLSLIPSGSLQPGRDAYRQGSVYNCDVLYGTFPGTSAARSAFFIGNEILVYLMHIFNKSLVKEMFEKGREGGISRVVR